MKDRILALNHALATKSKLRWVQTKQHIVAFFQRTAGTSGFGVVVQGTGLAALVYGVNLIYPPAAWIITGGLFLLLGEKL